MRSSIICVLAIIVLSESLPIKNLENHVIVAPEMDAENVATENLDEVLPRNDRIKVASIETTSDKKENETEQARALNRNSIRPGTIVTGYAVTLEPDVNSGTFHGIAEVDVTITDLDTREDDIVLHVEALNINSVTFRIGGGSIIFDAGYEVDEDDNLINIWTGRIASQYTFIFDYSGSLETAGVGLYAGHYQNGDYVAMNLYPTYARRVFPCMDEPTEGARVSFTFNVDGYQHLVFNSRLEDNSNSQFVAMHGPPHVFGMVAHNFQTAFFPTASGVQVYGRTGFTNQDAQATAINFFFNNLNTWTNKEYFDIDLNQDGRMVIMALPDVSTDWTALSIVSIWEPYVIMEAQHAVMQRSTGLVKVAEAMSRQWFGYVVYPENWRHEWVVTGLGTYAAWEILRLFQAPSGGASDISFLDINTLFVTEVIQESLLRDAYATSTILEPGEDIFEGPDIWEHIRNVKYKSAALMRMIRLILGDEDQDFIQIACQSMLNSRSLQTVNSISFYDGVNSEFAGNQYVEDIEWYMEQWLENTGYPVITIATRSGGVIVTQQRFSLNSLPQVSFEIPITYTTSRDPNFDNIYPQLLTDGTALVDIYLDEDDEDWVVFNIQGQGYYRVNYGDDLWERLIEALDDPDRREVIHPLNRATLVDDALNLARAGTTSYENAFMVVLSMEHETEYAPWRAFIRNMEFLRKRLVAYFEDDPDEREDMYVRMVRRTVIGLENELGFDPDPMISEPAMDSLTRGIVMDHACRAGYQPCIAAAVDWFYASGTDEPTVNPDIPHDIRPAVYCAMMREGGNDVIQALENRLQIETTQYERVVILESFGCSQDTDFINVLLESTLAGNSDYLAEEKFRILASVIQSSYHNALLGLNFMARRTNEIKQMYGGTAKLNELIYLMAENCADDFLSTEFNNWRSDRHNMLDDDSQEAADRAYQLVLQNLVWDARYLEFVYEWIDENDATTSAISILLLLITAFIALFNH